MCLTCGVSLVCHEIRRAAAHTRARNQIQAFDLTIQKPFLLVKSITSGALVSASISLIDRGVKEGMCFTAKSLAIVCALLMDSLPLMVRWPP